MEIYEGKKQLHQQQPSSKSSRSPSPEPVRLGSPVSDESLRRLGTPSPSRIGPPPSPPVPTHPVAPVAPEPSGPLALMPCLVCGRTFVPQSLSKHVKICEKMTVKKRKTFDSSRQRREGTDLEQYLPKNFGLPENSPFLEKSPPPTAKPTPKPKPQSVRNVVAKPAADLQKCPHCNRAFGVRAFERHVEWCADKAKILPAAPAHPPQHIADAKQRLNARTQYKAPLVRHRRSSQTRDKSSNSRSASVDSSRGVSPPPPPREYGDYKSGRTRASESMSSNDCHEETSPHMPVIKNARNPQNSISGDANVRARQARLARDLSSSREHQDPHSSNVQHSSTDPSLIKDNPKLKQKNKIHLKKQQQLKKLEDTANKYNEKIKTENDVKQSIGKNEKSSIPVIKKRLPDNQQAQKHEDTKKSNLRNKKETKTNFNNSEIDIKIQSTKVASKKLKNNVSEVSTVNIHDKTTLVKEKEKVFKQKNKIDSSKVNKSSTMSLDSLEDNSSNLNFNKNFQSVGINTELLCVPCVIHNNVEQKNNKICIKNMVSSVKNIAKEIDNNISETRIELLYKNPIMTSSTDVIEKCIAERDSKEEVSCLKNITPNNSHKYINIENDVTESIVHLDENTAIKKNLLLDEEVGMANPVSNTEFLDIESDENMTNLSVENIEEGYEHDLSEEMFDDTIQNKLGSESDRRHGSGETYTKFTENPADLEEFMVLTDQMMDNQLNKNVTVDSFHTPKTNSIEAINDNTSEVINNDISKHHFSFTFEELKSNFSELVKGVENYVKDNVKKEENIENEINSSNDNKNVNNMEHISVYELKFNDSKSIKIQSSDFQTQETSDLKLPSITNKHVSKKKDKDAIHRLFNPDKKHKMLGDQTRKHKEYQTFIVNENLDDSNSDGRSVSSEAPPLKLPRIEEKRLDDNYDPFESAARQMKELMSSETSIPKKVQNSTKDLSRTLPLLRPTKEKSPLSNSRSDNTKMMKDTLNKTYQKTPQLQRMKSFGSTNNDNNNRTFGGRCSSFRINRNDKKTHQKINTTFNKSSKENLITSDKISFNRNSNLNRSFSSYAASSYSTPKPRDKMPKISTSMYHSFQRSTLQQPLKLDKINKEDEKKTFVNLDSILVDDNSSMTDSSYIDPRLINENDNLPINVNTILNNPDIISSMESLLTTENLPAKFDSFSSNVLNNNRLNILPKSNPQNEIIEANNNRNKITTPIIDNLSAQYEKIMSSLEQSIASKTSVRDDESLCEDFDLEEFISSFDDEINKHKSENKRTCSSTTRVITQSQLAHSKKTSEVSSVSSSPKVSNGMIPVNKSMSFNFSSNNIVNENLFPSCVKRSTSLLDSIQKKGNSKTDSGKNNNKTEQLEQDFIQSLKDFEKFNAAERIESYQSKKESINYNNTVKRDARLKSERRIKKNDVISNGNYNSNGKSSNDSAYSSMNRISPSKLSVCTKEPNGLSSSVDHDPIGTDSGGSHKEDIRSISSDEFLAMERSAELEEPIPQSDTHHYKDIEPHMLNEKRVSSRASSRRSPAWKQHGELSSSGSEVSLHRRDSGPAAPRYSRFCHECGHKFPVETAKFCMECGVKRLLV